MWLVVGLGNPGTSYAHTRHNAGFLAIDHFAAAQHAPWTEEKNMAVARTELHDEKVFLLKPYTFMNLSGDAVQHVMRFYKIPADHLIVIHDDLDFPLGIVKAQFDRSAAGHNGVTDIIEKLGTQAFHRIRIGIGPQNGVAENFVLQQFTQEDAATLKPTFDKAIALLQDSIK